MARLRPPGSGVAEHGDRPLVGGDGTEQHEQRRRLAGAVGPEEGDALAGVDGQRDAGHGRVRLYRLTSSVASRTFIGACLSIACGPGRTPGMTRRCSVRSRSRRAGSSRAASRSSSRRSLRQLARRSSLIRPSATAACTTQPGSRRWVQSAKRHWSRRAVISGKVRATPSPSALPETDFPQPGRVDEDTAAGEDDELPVGRGVPAPPVALPHLAGGQPCSGQVVGQRRLPRPRGAEQGHGPAPDRSTAPRSSRPAPVCGADDMEVDHQRRPVRAARRRRRGRRRTRGRPWSARRPARRRSPRPA